MLMRRFALSLSLLALAGCTGTGTLTTRSAPRQQAPAKASAPLPSGVFQLPHPTANALIALGAVTSLGGKVELKAVTESYFANNGAQFGLLSIPTANALINVATLEEDLYTSSGNVVAVGTDANGNFNFTNQVPSSGPFTVIARLAGDHRLSAIVMPGTASATVDEATSMVAEMARWQLLPFADAGRRDLTDVSASDLNQLHTDTTAVLAGGDLEVTAGTAPSIAALKTGAGHLLRSIYVAAFGAKVTDAGASTPPEANALSDKWKDILGYRPLALTRVAGNAVRGYNQGEDLPATDTSLSTPTDAIEDAAGNLYVAELENYLIRVVPRTDIAAPYLQSTGNGGSGSLQAGRIYTVAGVVNSSRNSDDYNQAFADEAASDAAGAPAITTAGYPIFSPARLELQETATSGKPNVYFSSPFDARVFAIAQEAATHYGVAMQPGHLYPIAGTGTNYYNVNNGTDPSGDGAIATDASLGFPYAMCRDAADNLYVLDAGANSKGEIRLIRHSDGFIFTIAVEMDSSTLPLNHAGDIKLSPDKTMLYVADSERHFVFRIPVPTPGAINGLAANPPAQVAERVLGNPGRRGFMDIGISGVFYPDTHEINNGVAESVTGGIQVLLDTPTALEFTPAGDLLVADANRIRLVQGGQVYTIGGGLDSTHLGGDSRLGYYPATGSLRYCPSDKNVLLTDSRLNIVRRLWTRRGFL
jgi:hypothetical protein